MTVTANLIERYARKHRNKLTRFHEARYVVTERDRDIIARRERGATYEAIAEVYHLSRERVLQLYKRALRVLAKEDRHAKRIAFEAVGLRLKKLKAERDADQKEARELLEAAFCAKGPKVHWFSGWSESGTDCTRAGKKPRTSRDWREVTCVPCVQLRNQYP